MASDVHAVVSFNVGGQTFTTIRETLLKEANSRLALIARGLLAAVRDPSSGAYLLDRDPKYFQLILNWLRDGWCLLPRTPDERRELIQEVRYYQLTTFEGWLRTQELLSETGAYNAQDVLAIESPQPRMQQQHPTSIPPPFQLPPQQLYLGQQAPTQQPHYSPYGYATFGSPAPAPALGPASPRGPASTLTTAGLATARITSTPPAWMGTGPPPGSAGTTSSLPPSSHHHNGAALGSGSPLRAPSAYGPGGVPPALMTGGWGGGGGTAAVGAPGSAIASLREAFLSATAPQRPAQPVPPYSLSATAEEASSWTSKYLKGNEPLRELVNTLLELAFMAPHRSLNVGKVHLSVHVECGHGTEASLVGNKEDQLRSKLMEVRVKGALGWMFELILRPSSEAALWDKYGGVAAAVQDNWFVLGAILKDQFGVVMEEDAASRPTCMACRRTCLSIILKKIY